jgi:hypothetical protein
MLALLLHIVWHRPVLSVSGVSVNFHMKRTAVFQKRAPLARTKPLFLSDSFAGFSAS